MGKKFDLRLIFEIVLVLAVAALCVICFWPEEEAAGFSLYYYTPNGTLEDGPYAAGTKAKLLSGEEIEGYTFLGWRNEQGIIEKSEEIYVNEDTYFSAVYAMALNREDHIVFLDSEDGLFRPDDPLTNAEAAEMFYRLISKGTVGSGSFEDVSQEDSYYAACATLKDLGVFSGNYFHPEDSVSRKGFAEMLSCFCPDWEAYVEDADSEEEITREETAGIMCAVLGRTGDSEDKKELLGTFLDVSPNSGSYWAIAESTISHEFEEKNGEEVWTSCDAMPTYEPGYFFIKGALHYIDEEGCPVIDATVDGLYFNDRGEESSGNKELDKKIQNLIYTLTDPDTMESSEMLKILFDYVSGPTTFNYLVRNYYDVGDTSWAAEEALTMLKTLKGNCYNFAAVFYELARGIGYDAKLVSGTMGASGDVRPHAWVEIEFGGEYMLFDTEYQYAHSYSNAYKRDREYMTRYHYKEE